MSAVIIRSLLEGALATITPALSTAYENTPFTPVVGTPYQRVNILFAEPGVLEMSGKMHREQGFMQVTLCYPLDAGTAGASARAELIRTIFYRGRDFVSGNVTVTIDRHPEIRPAQTDDDRYVLPVRVRFYSNIVRS